MFSAEAAGVLKEFAEHGGGNKVTFLGNESGAAGDIAKHQRQGLSGGRRCVHVSNSP
jgi:hypothetical protein